MVLVSLIVSKALRANGCTQSLRKVVCISGILRNITVMLPRRRELKAGPLPQEKKKGEVVRVLEKERVKAMEVVSRTEKKKAKAKVRTKAKAKENAKVKEKEKGHTRTTSAAKCAARPDASTLGWPVVGTLIARGLVRTEAIPMMEQEAM